MHTCDSAMSYWSWKQLSLTELSLRLAPILFLLLLLHGVLFYYHLSKESETRPNVLKCFHFGFPTNSDLWL